LERVEASGSAADRLGWALDALAVVTVLSPKNVSAAADVLAALGMLANRAQEAPLWEAWATGISGIGYWLKDGVRRERLNQELKACAAAHGTAEMRAAWAQAAAPANGDKRPLNRQREVLGEIRVLADRYAEPLVRAAWANGVLNCFSQELRTNPAAA